jgi:large subunit ribosomal protein L29
MKQSIVKDLTTDEVREKIKEERAAYTKLKMAHAVSPG